MGDGNRKFIRKKDKKSKWCWYCKAIVVVVTNPDTLRSVCYKCGNKLS